MININKIDNKYINYITNYLYDKLVSINDSYIKGRTVIIQYGINNTYSIFLPPLTQTNPLLYSMMSLNNIPKLTQSINTIKPINNIKPSITNIDSILDNTPLENTKVFKTDEDMIDFLDNLTY